MNITFLTEEQIFGRNKLDIINKRGTKAAMTDFSILLGGFVSDNYHIDGGNSLQDRTGYYWTKTDDGDNDARVVIDNGDWYNYDVDYRSVGARTALPYSSISNISSNVVKRRGGDGLLEVEHGRYPQTAVPRQLQEALENLYYRNALVITGNTYTTDSKHYKEYNSGFKAQTHTEYEYNGKRYVRIIANSCFDGDAFKLSNGESYRDGDPVWVEVEPVKWLVDERQNIMLTESLIFAGVQFNRERNYKTSNFDRTDIKKFMNNHLSRDLFQTRTAVQSITTEEVNIENNTFPKRRRNPYELNFENVSEEDIIRGAIQSGIAPFLHGRSSEGKSARVKQLDPDCEIIYLRNATPDSLNGKSVYNSVTGEMIDVKPTWLKRLEEKCEKEKDKIHIVFFDEITNALHSIQGMAFNIVLNREVNGIWKLPENARVVAAGNDLNDSLAANTLAEPLFNRFAHVYINTTVQSWLEWAGTPEQEYQRLDYSKQEYKTKIHPAIYAYIAYKGESALRTEYNGETPNADPRKWEMASKVLYTTRQPEMLRALIGQDLTREFTEFCRQQVISIEDVINGNYNQNDLEMNTAEKFATAVGLSSVDDKNLEKVRNFVMKLGPEICATFDNLWIRGSEERLEKIAELRAATMSEGGIRR